MNWHWFPMLTLASSKIKMKQDLTVSDLNEIEKQLSKPSGQNGIEIGKRMNVSNIEMTKNSIKFLDIAEGNAVLEMGHGNCGHLEFLLKSAHGIKYLGLEISETMFNEAQKLNSNSQAEFKLYDGRTLPFTNESFDRIMTVNTIYFWSNPEELITEIERTLKSDGIFILTYADKSFMENLPFVGERFKLFEREDIQELVEKSNLQILEFIDKKDTVISKAGDQVLRKYTIAKIRKDKG